MTEVDWIDTCVPAVATGALEVLDEVLAGLDLEEDGATIEPFPQHVYRGGYDYTRDDEYLAERMRFVQMLKRKGVIASAMYDKDIGQRGMIRVAAVRETVVMVRERLRRRVYGEGSIEKRRVFIGHGGASDWRDLRDLLRDRIGLEVVEFKRESPAGMSTKARVEEMLNSAEFAFLVFTAEDEHADGTKHARENVIHELGLFQAKFGSKRAVIVLEDGCKEFTNIHGIGQIRFKSGQLIAKSEEVRQVLEREGIIPGPGT